MNLPARLLFAVCAMAAAAAAPAAVQNLLANGDFASGIELGGWEFPDAMPTYSAFDIDNASDSGSAYALNASTDPFTQLVVLRQCVPITQAGVYILTASGYADTGQSASGNLAASYALAPSQTDCGGGFSTLGGGFIESTGQWTSFASGAAINVPNPPAPSMSIQVLMRVDKNEASGTFGGYFDAISLVRDTLFIDGFE